MATVKLVIGEDRTFMQGGKTTYTSKLMNFTVDSVQFGKDKRGDVCKVSFLEDIKWSAPNTEEVIDTFPYWSSAFQSYEINLSVLQEIKRGFSVNATLQLKSGDKGWFQEIDFINTAENDATPSVHEAIPHTKTKVDVPIEKPEEEQKEISVHKEEVEDVSLPPEAEFRFPIPYHDRRNLSIQRQQSIKFALELLQTKLKDLHNESEEVFINNENIGCSEIEEFIWDGIQALWNDIPREIGNDENSKK